MVSPALFAKEYHNFQINGSVVASDYDEEIAELCFNQAAAFLETNKDIDDPEIKAQCIVLDYLIFRLMNNSTRKYIPTKELMNQLKYMGYKSTSTSTFRLKIICKLRDAGVIIASSQRGYKMILSISLDTFSTQNSKQVRNQLFEMEQIYMERSGMDICSISVAA